MSKTIKNNCSNSMTCKKVKKFGGDFLISGVFTLCERRTKNMKIFNLAGAHLALSGNLLYGGAKMKKFKIKWGLLPMSGGFTFCINQTKGEIMIKAKKRIFVNQRLIKKFVLGWEFFPVSGIFTLRERRIKK